MKNTAVERVFPSPNTWICHSLETNGKAAAAEKLAEALHHFDHSNLLLAEAVALAKED